MVAIPWSIVKKYRWTVDVEYDWGGRTHGIQGLTEGLPKIIQAFAKARVKAIFFISTELLPENEKIIKTIQKAGHEIGSHGHKHIKWRDNYKASIDEAISLVILNKYFEINFEECEYRAPKFSYQTNSIYSNKKNHVGLLKYMWLGGQITGNTIFYLHPFDIVRETNPPNLFCRLWYSKPEKAYETFISLLNRYQ